VLGFAFLLGGILDRYGALLVILGSALWGTDALFRRPLTASLSPVTIVLLEHCVLAIAVLPVATSRLGELKALTRRDYAALLLIALGGSVGATSLFTFAMKYGNPSVVILLQKTQPLFAVLLATILLRERPGNWFWPWFALAMAGTYLTSAPDWRAGVPLSPGHPVIVVSALAAALLWGSSTVCGRYVIAKVSTPFLTALRFLFALPALAVLYGLQPHPLRGLPADSWSALSIVEMALIPGLAALLLYYRGLRSTIASVTSVCELSFPITAVAVNWLFLGVRLSAVQMAGSALLVSSVTAIAWNSSRLRGQGAPKPIQS
jgi:drug/metabolite transporter (DMT)-like permease